jgi:helicase associated protein
MPDRLDLAEFCAILLSEVCPQFRIEHAVGVSCLAKAETNPWEKGFDALRRFRAREGHCRTSRFHIEEGYNLGPWVSNQRYYKYKLSSDRRRRLNAIGFIWNWRDYLWEQGFAALLKFKAREGHCLVPSLHIEGKYKLGYWVSSQRRNKTKISSERRSRLNRIVFVWNPRNAKVK